MTSTAYVPLLSKEEYQRQSVGKNFLEKLFGGLNGGNSYSQYLPPVDEFDQYLSPLAETSEFGNVGDNTNSFFVEYVNFPKEIKKKQFRPTGKCNQQRLDKVASKIKLILLFEQPVSMKDIFKIELKVHRAQTLPNHANYFAGHALLCNRQTMFYQLETGSNEITVVSDLDSVYEVDGEKVYELSKGTPRFNEFCVLIQVYFHSGSKSEFETQKFVVVGDRTRKHKLDYDEESSSSSPRFTKYLNDPNGAENFAKVQKLVTDRIEAKQGSFGELFAKVIKSGSGDIAYHFVWKDQYCDEEIEPGQIVGFTTDESGKAVIQKLTLHNSKDMFLKGVVTDSQYLECNFNENEKTATVCMLGLVPVNVIGSVYNGEGLYASPEHPGVAISEHYLDKVLNKDTYKPALIGYAFQQVNSEGTTVHQVQALVSLINSADHEIMHKQLFSIETRLKFDIADTARRYKKRIRRCTIACVLLALIFSILVTILIYQLHTPGSQYKYWQCKRHSVGTSNYWYWLKGKAMHGIEMTSCEEAWERATDRKRFHRLPRFHHLYHDYACLNETEYRTTFRYYINLDSCAEVINAHARYLFAIDNACSSVFHVNEKTGGWDRDIRICDEPKCNIKCSFQDKRKQNCDVDEACVFSSSNMLSKNSSDDTL